MFSQRENTQMCALCNGTNFYTEDGYYFCSKCQTQNEDIREQIYDSQYDPNLRLRKVKIRSEKSDKEDIIGWTSWELYNFVLIGLTNELVEIGIMDPNVKLTILQLWTMYLSKLEVAFISKNKRCIPRMARRYHKKDKEIIYGKIQQRRRNRKKQNRNPSASSMLSSLMSSDGSRSSKNLAKSKRLLIASEYDKFLQSQASSDTDGMSSLNQSLYSLKSSISNTSSTAVKIRFNKKARLEAKKIKAMSKKISRSKRVSYNKKHITSQYAAGPDVVTPLKLWSIIYLALRINNQDIHVSDMLRFSREGHLSYYKLDHLIPSEVLLTKSDINLLTQTVDISHKGLRKTAADMAKFLKVHELAKPNFLGLIQRYSKDLELPKGVQLYAERLFLTSPSTMKFTIKSPIMPNYEARAMAYIIVVLKILFGLDDITENVTSQLIEKVNRKAYEKDISTAKLFSFNEWQRFVECRKSILTHLHFPSKIKYDPECTGTSHLYLRFMGLMKSKRDAEAPEVTNSKHVLSKNLVSALYQCIDNLNDNSILLKEMEIFSPSLTPLRSYVEQLVENPHYELPSILTRHFYDTKVGYVTKPDSLMELASQCGINLQTVDCNVQYLEKFVPPFEQPPMPTLEELSKLVEVVTPTSDKNSVLSKTENLLDYSHKHRLCRLEVNFHKLKHYSLAHSKLPLELDESLDLEEDSYFDQILPDGRLNIHDDSDSENEISSKAFQNEEHDLLDSSCLLNAKFLQKYNVKLFDHEIQSLLNAEFPSKRVKYTPNKDKITGRFMKASEKKDRARRKEFENMENFLSSDSSEKESQIKPKLKKQNNKRHTIDTLEDEVTEVPIDCYDSSDPELSILENCDETNSASTPKSSLSNCEFFFRPYKDYWMYHCIFSRVKGKNFELFEKELPENFLWLLNECANIVEMSTEELYEEVCLIEAYHLNVLQSKKSKRTDNALYDYKSKLYSNKILNKW